MEYEILGGRFPEDNEFERLLRGYVNTSYAKALMKMK